MRLPVQESAGLVLLKTHFVNSEAFKDGSFLIFSARFASASLARELLVTCFCLIFMERKMRHEANKQIEHELATQNFKREDPPVLKWENKLGVFASFTMSSILHVVFLSVISTIPPSLPTTEWVRASEDSRFSEILFSASPVRLEPLPTIKDKTGEAVELIIGQEHKGGGGCYMGERYPEKIIEPYKQVKYFPVCVTVMSRMADSYSRDGRRQGRFFWLGNPASNEPFIIEASPPVDAEVALDALMGSAIISIF
jgi:hypothetical protein